MGAFGRVELRAWVDARGGNVTRTAVELGIPRTQLQGYLSGRHKVPALLRRLCVVLDELGKERADRQRESEPFIEEEEGEGWGL